MSLSVTWIGNVSSDRSNTDKYALDCFSCNSEIIFIITNNFTVMFTNVLNKFLNWQVVHEHVTYTVDVKVQILDLFFAGLITTYLLHLSCTK